MSIYSNPANSTTEETAAYVGALLALIGDQDPLEVLAGMSAALERVLRDVPAPLTTRPEAPGKWSIRDVVQHLADSELVAGFRLRMILAQDRPPLAAYDQDLWASRLRYREVSLQDALEQFVVLRRANLRLWAALTRDDLARVGVHGERGEESLERLRQLYAAHDLLHLRQLERIRVAEASAAARL
jgi:hypothetical protein